MGRLFPGGSALDVIRVVQAPAINSVAPLLLSAWINVIALDATNRRILDKTTGAAGNGSFRWRINNSTILFSATLWNTTAGSWTIPTISGGQVGTWVHLGISYNFGFTTDDPVMYINGVSQTVTRVTGPVGTKVSETTDLAIGNDETGLALCFNGSLAEISMCNNTLSAARMALLAGGMGIVQLAQNVGLDLRGYWPLCGLAGPGPAAPNPTATAELDYSGNGNTGLVNGTNPIVGPPGVATACSQMNTGFGGAESFTGQLKPTFAGGVYET